MAELKERVARRPTRPADASPLLVAAREASRNAYAPYSGFAVGCAVLLTDGSLVSSANMENASLGVTMCAEVGALMAANARGMLAEVSRIAVMGYKFHPEMADGGIVTPCGRCRQLIAEASQLGGRNIRIECGNSDLTVVLKTSAEELLPHAFGPEALGLTDHWRTIRGKLR